MFDVIRVRVLSAILPHSPVQVLRGGEINWRFADDFVPDSQQLAGASWFSGDPGIVAVVDGSPLQGKMRAVREGQTKVWLKNHM